MQPTGVGDELLNPHLRMQWRNIRQVTQPTLYLEWLLGDVIARDRGGTRIGANASTHDIHGGRLAGAVGAEEADDLTFSYAKRDVVQGLDCAIALR